MPPLTAEIATVQAALAAFERALTPAAPADMALFIQQRVRLAKRVNAFMADEREKLNALSLMGSNVITRAEQESLFKALVDLRLTYSDHIARWDNRTIAADWATYRSNSQGLIAAMRNLLDVRAAALLARAA